MLSSWKCYQHMMLPSCAPHEVPDLSPIEDGTVFNAKGMPILARWTTDFDCGYETDFWYVIKDTPFDISKLKAKRRYEITKGMRNFEVKRIKVVDYVDDMVDVMESAYASWPSSYRPIIEREQWKHEFQRLDETLPEGATTNCVYGAFDIKGYLSGFAHVVIHETFAAYSMLRVNPQTERLGINAAITYTIMQDLEEKLSAGNYYLSDGTRNVSHETHF